MEAFLNWLFGHEGRLHNVLEYIYSQLAYLADWTEARLSYYIEAWFGHAVDILDSWYIRIKQIFWELWEFTHDLVANLYANLRQVADVHFPRIWFLIWQGWHTLTLIVNEWWSVWYDFWTNLVGRVIQIVSDWYDILSELVQDLWERLREIILDWYEDLLYLIQSLPSIQQLLGDWSTWLAWLFSTEVRELLFAFLQDPLGTIWLYITDAIEDKLEELLDALW